MADAAAHERTGMSCGGHDIRDVGEIAADCEFACTCGDCGTSVVIAIDGFRVVEPKKSVVRSRGREVEAKAA